MKHLKWILIGVAALLVIGFVAVYLNLNGIVRRTVQSQATASLNLQTTVGGANVALFGGRLGLSDIRISSPEGFSAPSMFALDGTRVAVTWGQLRSDPVHIQEIVIDRPHLVVEHRGGTFNFDVLMDREPAPPAEGEPMRVIINQLQVNNARVTLHPGIPGLASEIDVNIPSFSLANIGTGEGAENGAAIKEVVMLLVTTMAAQAAEAQNLPPEVQMLLKGNIEGVARQMASEYGGRAMEQLQKNLPPEIGGALGEIIGGTTRPGEDPGRAVEEGLRGLLDRRDRDRNRDGDRDPTTRPR